MFGVFDHEINQALALEPAEPHVVALPLDDFQRHGATQFVVPLLDDG